MHCSLPVCFNVHSQGPCSLSLVIWLWSEHTEEIVRKVVWSSFPLKHLLVYRVQSKIRKDLWSQGIGRHSEQDLCGIAERDLLAVSDILGEKKFLFGEIPCLADAGLFAFIAASAWACPESPFDVLLRSKAKNLESHARRMKELYYPDWDKIISSKSISD